MKKVRSVYRVSLIIYLVIILGILYSIFTVIRLFPSTQEMYEGIWNIKLPDNLEVVYDIHTPTSFHGDGERYTVFKVQEDFIMRENRKGQNDYKKREEQEKFALGILELLDVSPEERPNFNNYYVWKVHTKESDKLLMMYFADNHCFYLFQHLQ
ncbi:MAG: hypothetical protein OSJ62_12320 [Lachnospiraceae bacterium]|nr:hypothetical protein [Lachnospiraceae bacterium]